MLTFHQHGCSIFNCYCTIRTTKGIVRKPKTTIPYSNFQIPISILVSRDIIVVIIIILINNYHYFKFSL